MHLPRNRSKGAPTCIERPAHELRCACGLQLHLPHGWLVPNDSGTAASIIAPALCCMHAAGGSHTASEAAPAPCSTQQA